jgi:hypothetical protein
VKAQEPLGDDSGPVRPSGVEKVNFPSVNHPVPTFAAIFRSGNETRPKPDQLGSTVYRTSLDDWGIQPYGTHHVRAPSVSSSSDASLSRTGSATSYADLSEKSKEEKRVRDRWVIE